MFITQEASVASEVFLFLLLQKKKTFPSFLEREESKRRKRSHPFMKRRRKETPKSASFCVGIGSYPRSDRIMAAGSLA